MTLASVVVLAWGEEPHLRECVAAVLASVGLDGLPLDLEVLLVDNGAPAAVAAVPEDPRVRLLRPGSNLGFAGGVDHAATHANGEHLVLVNSDALVAPDAVAVLLGALADPAVGVVSGEIRLADRPHLMNTVGNPVTFVGLVWAGGYGESSELHQSAADVSSASGAFLAVRREVWDRLGGFDTSYFAYHEDTDLSLRAWLAGYRVRYVPGAVAVHHYAFSRNAAKHYLLERNRWLTVLTVWPPRVLAAALPAMLALEVPMLLLAVVQGWLPAKLRGYGWLLRHRDDIAARRREVQADRQLPEREFAALLSAAVEPAGVEAPTGQGVLNVLLRGYWWAAVRLAGLR